MNELISKSCKPCEGGVEPLLPSRVEELLPSLSNGWKMNQRKHLENEMHFVNFRHTMNMVNKIAQLAEAEGHHPDLHISYGTLRIECWTHSIQGLSENDFILAAKIDQL